MRSGRPNRSLGSPPRPWRRCPGTGSRRSVGGGSHLEAGFDAEQQRVPALSDFIEAHEPRLIAFDEYVNTERSEVTVVQVHPDAASFEFHLGVVGDRAREAYAQTLEATTSIEVFGTPTETILRTLRQQAGSGIRLNIYPHHLGGFTRAPGN
jgi:hypothetical protein